MPKKKILDAGKVRAKTLAYLEIAAAGKELQNPRKAIAEEVFLSSFGLPPGEGLPLAKKIILELESDGVIACLRSAGGTVRSLRLVPRVPESISVYAAPQVAVAEKPKKEPAAPASARRQAGRPLILLSPRKTVPSRPTTREMAEENERRFFLLAHGVLEKIEEVAPAFVVWRDCEQSGRHNPGKGRHDWRDHAGDDVCITLFVLNEDGGVKGGRMIYDVKSSFSAARERNKNIVFFEDEGQADALLKKAVCVNQRRSDAEITAEILDDMIGAGFGKLKELKEEILANFA